MNPAADTTSSPSKKKVECGEKQRNNKTESIDGGVLESPVAKTTRRRSSSSISKSPKKQKKRSSKKASKKESSRTAKKRNSITEEEEEEDNNGGGGSGEHLWEEAQAASESRHSPLHCEPPTVNQKQLQFQEQELQSAKQQQSSSLSPAWDPLVLNQASWRKQASAARSSGTMALEPPVAALTAAAASLDNVAPSTLALATNSPISSGDVCGGGGTTADRPRVRTRLNKEVEGAWADFVTSPFVASRPGPHGSSNSFMTPSTAASTELTSNSHSTNTFALDSWKLPSEPLDTSNGVIFESGAATSSSEHLSSSLSRSDASSSLHHRLAGTTTNSGSSSGGHAVASANTILRRYDSFKSISCASTLSGNTDKYNTVASIMSAESEFVSSGLSPEEAEQYFKTMARMTLLMPHTVTAANPQQPTRVNSHGSGGTSSGSGAVDISSVSLNSGGNMSISTHSKTSGSRGKGGGANVAGGGGPLTIFEEEPSTMYSSSISFSMGAPGVPSADGTVAGGISCESTIATEDDGTASRCSIKSNLLGCKEQLMVEDLMSRGVPHHIAVLVVKEHMEHLRSVVRNHKSQKFATSMLRAQQSQAEVAAAGGGDDTNNNNNAGVMLNLPDTFAPWLYGQPRGAPCGIAQPGAVSIRGGGGGGVSSETLSFSGGSGFLTEGSMPYPPSAAPSDGSSNTTKKFVTFAGPAVQATAVALMCDQDGGKDLESGSDYDDGIKYGDDTTKSGESHTQLESADGIIIAESKPLSIASLLREPNVQRFLALMLVCLAIVIAVSTVMIEKAQGGGGSSREENPVQDSGPPILTTSDVPSTAPSYIAKDILDAAAGISTWFDVLQDGTPQRKAVGWLSSVDTYPLGPTGDSSADAGAIAEDRFLQRYTLLVLYYSTHGENWAEQDNWLNPTEHECSWSETIFCRDDGTVAEVNLNNNGLAGTIPEEIQWLSLRVLRLSDNNIGGTIPPTLCFGSTSSLGVVELDHNQLTGTIPDYMALCKDKLQTLDLSHNRLEGSLPLSLGDLTWVESLNLSRNLLKGSIPPNILEDMSSLQTIDLRSNAFTGTIPSMPSNLKELTSVHLDNNLFTGELQFLSSLATSVKTFTASGNQIDGSLTYGAALNSWTDEVEDPWSSASTYDEVKLETLDLSDNSLSGSLPRSVLNSLPTLRYLDLSDNNLSGSLRREDMKTSSLEHLSLARNAFSGSIFWNDAAFLSKLTHLDIADNGFAGALSLDPFLINHDQLRTLDLSRNAFVGMPEIPTNIGSASSLEVVRLVACGLGGTIPTEIGGLNKLEILDVSQNELNGPIPTELGFIQSLETLHLNDNGLEGPWPDELNSLPNLIGVAIGGNNMLSGYITPELCEQANVTAEGMGCDMKGPCISYRRDCG